MDEEIIKFAEDLKKEYDGKISSNEIGIITENMFHGFFNDCGVENNLTGHNEHYDIVIENKKIEVKHNTINEKESNIVMSLQKEEYDVLDYLLAFVKNNKENKTQYLFLNKEKIKKKNEYIGKYKISIPFSDLLDIEKFVLSLKLTFKISISKEEIKENLQNEIQKYNLENLETYSNKKIGDTGEFFATNVLKTKYNIVPKSKYKGYYDFKIENKLFDVKVYKYNPNHPNIPHIYRRPNADKKTMNLVFFVYDNDEMYYMFSTHIDSLTIKLSTDFKHLTSLSDFIQDFDYFYNHDADITTIQNI